MAENEEVVHLFREGSMITVCCRRHAMDSRLKIGTYDPEARTCPVDLRTAQEWVNDLNLMILDPDGWDRTNFTVSWNEPITREEFMRRARRSTVDMKRFDELEAEARA